jgi:quercetin dioxygenase-like cupin family protein
MTKTRVCTWDEIAPYGDDKADRRVVAGTAGDLKRVCVRAGTMAARHAHDFEQFFMVAEGLGVLTCADGEIVLKPGVVIHFEPDVWHEARFETDTVIYEVNFKKV